MSESSDACPDAPPCPVPKPPLETGTPEPCALAEALDEPGTLRSRGRALRVLWSDGPSGVTRPMRMRVAVATDLRLDWRTGRIFSVDGTTDPEAHLRTLGGRRLRPGYLFGPDGALHPCERLRLPWFDAGFARDGVPLVVVDTPHRWSGNMLADVLGVGVSGRPGYDWDFAFEWIDETPRRVVAAGEPFAVLSWSAASHITQSCEARVVDGRIDYRERPWPAYLRRSPGPWVAELEGLVPEDLGLLTPLLVHPHAAGCVAARLRAAVPPPGARPATVWRPTPAHLDGPTDYRHWWHRALQMALDPSVWAALGAVELPDRLWLARDFGGRVERALRARPRSFDAPLTEAERTGLARGLALWTPVAALDPADDAPRRASRVAWSAEHAVEAPLPLLCEWLAAEITAGREAAAAWDALAARWQALIALGAVDRQPLPVLGRWEVPASLVATAGTREVARLVDELALVADPLDFRLAWPDPWRQEVVAVAVAPDLGAALRAWFEGEVPVEEHSAEELLALANALSAQVIDPSRPFRVHRGRAVGVEACWRDGALRFREENSAGRWTRDLDALWYPRTERPQSNKVHPALRVHLDGLRRAERGGAWVMRSKRAAKTRVEVDRYALWRLPYAPRLRWHPYATSVRECELVIR